MTKRVALYLRVSTSDQTTDNQRIALVEVADAAGWEIVHIYQDEGISGSQGRDRRPGFDAMCKAITRREFDMVACWHVDRLGRSLQHLVTFLAELDGSGVDLYLHQQSIDTSTPAGKMMFGMLSVFAEFEKSMIAERVKAGLARAKKNGKKFGRPKVTDYRLRDEIVTRRAAGETLRAIAQQVGIGHSTVAAVLRAV